MPKLLFPVLSIDEIVKSYQETIPDLDKIAIQNPKAVFVENLFKTLIQNIDADQEDENIEFAGLGILSGDGQLHKTAIPEARFINKWYNIIIYLYSVHLMNVVGIKDFTILDIINPESKKLIIQLSAIINFLKYYDEKSSVFADQVEEIVNLNTQKEKCFKESKDLIIKVQDAETQKQSERKEISSLETQIKETENLLNEYQNEVPKMKSKKHGIEKNIEIKKNSLEELKKEVVEYEHESTELRSNIISNPEKLNEEMDLMQNKVGIAKSEAREIEKEVTMIKGVNSSLIKNNKEIEVLVKTLKDVQEQGVEATKASELIQSKTDDIEEYEREYKNIDIEKKRIERAIKIKSESVNEMRKSGKEERQNKIIELEKVNEKYNTMKNISDENEIKMNKLQNAITILNNNVYNIINI